MELNLSGKTVLVTGATRGIGNSVAVEFQKYGAKVIGTGTAKDSIAKSSERSKDIVFHQVDFSNDSDIDRLVENLASEKVDILINNAGINRIAPFHEVDIHDFEEIQKVNVTAPLRIMKALLPGMIDRKFGRIVNITSIFGHVTKVQRASYSTSKFGLLGMTKALAVEHAGNNILANCIAPGFIDTELTRQVLGEKGIEEMSQKVPMKRMGNPHEIAKAIAFIGGPLNTYITGQNILVDGGFTSV